MIGSSKRIIGLFISNLRKQIPISAARFTNVAFSDECFTHGFNQRIQKNQATFWTKWYQSKYFQLSSDLIYA